MDWNVVPLKGLEPPTPSITNDDALPAELQRPRGAPISNDPSATVALFFDVSVRVNDLDNVASRLHGASGSSGTATSAVGHRNLFLLSGVSGGSDFCSSIAPTIKGSISGADEGAVPPSEGTFQESVSNAVQLSQTDAHSP